MQRQMVFPIVRGAAAMFVGYGVIVLLTSLGFNGVLGGRPLYGDSPLLLVAGMLVAVIAGLVGATLRVSSDPADPCSMLRWSWFRWLAIQSMSCSFSSEVPPRFGSMLSPRRLSWSVQ